MADVWRFTPRKGRAVDCASALTSPSSTWEQKQLMWVIAQRQHSDAPGDPGSNAAHARQEESALAAATQSLYTAQEGEQQVHDQVSCL